MPKNNAGKSSVNVIINGENKSIHRGNYEIDKLKEVLGVSPDYVLDEIIDDEFVEINDDSHYVIKGDESFVGHPRCGSSS